MSTLQVLTKKALIFLAISSPVIAGAIDEDFCRYEIRARYLLDKCQDLESCKQACNTIITEGPVREIVDLIAWDISGESYISLWGCDFDSAYEVQNFYNIISQTMAEYSREMC